MTSTSPSLDDNNTNLTSQVSLYSIAASPAPVHVAYMSHVRLYFAAQVGLPLLRHCYVGPITGQTDRQTHTRPNICTNLGGIIIM